MPTQEISLGNVSLNRDGSGITPISAKENFIYPTHKCFDDALDFLELILRFKGRNELLSGRYRLIHALCKKGIATFCHGWVEITYPEGLTAVFAGYLNNQYQWFTSPANEYRENMGAQKVWEYTIEQAWEENKRTGHYGPWEAELRPLCRESGQRIIA